MTVHCKKCGHQWNLRVKLPMEISRFVKVAEGFTAAGCPACDAHGKNVLCGSTPKAEAKS